MKAKTTIFLALLIFVCIGAIVFVKTPAVRKNVQTITPEMQAPGVQFARTPTDFQTIYTFGSRDGKSYATGRLKNGNHAIFYDGMIIGEYPGIIDDFLVVNNRPVVLVRTSAERTDHVLVYDYSLEDAEYDNRQAIDIGAYDFIRDIREFNGKPVFIVHKDNQDALVFAEDNIIGPFDAVLDFAIIGNDVAYIKEENLKRYVVFQNRTLGPYDRSGIYELAVIDGQLAYVYSIEHRYFVAFGDQTFGPYEYASDLIGAGGAAVFAATNGGRSFIVSNGEEPSGLPAGNAYCPVEVDGKIAYKADNGSGGMIVYNGKEESLSGREVTSVSCPMNINGKLAYVARERLTEDHLVFGGERFGPYAHIDQDSIAAVNGRIAFAVSLDGGYGVVFNGQITPLPADTFPAGRIADANGGWALRIRNSDQTQFYTVSESGVLGPYDRMSELSVINGTLAFTGEKDGRSFIFFNNQERETFQRYATLHTDYAARRFDGFDLSAPVDLGGKMAFAASMTSFVSGSALYEGLDVVEEDFQGRWLTAAGDGYAHIASPDGEDFVVYGGRQFGPFAQVESLMEHDGGLIFVSTDRSDKDTLHAGDESFGPYDDVSYECVSESGRLNYLKQQDGFYTWVDGDEEIALGREYAEMRRYFDGSEHKIFIVSDIASPNRYIVVDGEEFGKEMGYDEIGPIAIVDDAPVFIGLKYTYADGAYAEIAETKSFLYADGQEQALPYAYIEDFLAIDGVVAYASARDNVRYVAFGEQEFGPFDLLYDPVSGPGKGHDEPLVGVGGALVFVAHQDGQAVVFLDGKKIGGYESVSEIQAVNDKLFYIAVENGRKEAFYGGKQVASGYVPEALFLGIAGDKLVLRLKKDGKQFLLYGNDVIGPFDALGTENSSQFYSVVNGKAVFMAKEEDIWSVYAER